MARASKFSRRSLFKTAAGLGTGLGLGWAGCGKPQQPSVKHAAQPARKHAPMLDVAFKPRQEVRLGVVGVGLRGTSVMGQFLRLTGVKVMAVCDLAKEKTDAAQARVQKAGQPAPAAYFQGERGFEQLNRREDLDVVLIATPWRWHTPMALDAMQQGKHVLVEVPAATSVEDCWRLVDTSEATRRHCVMLENCCYGAEELMVLQMVRDGVFGELKHGEAAYLHDLRWLLFENKDEGLWRRFHHTIRDGNLYPTHGLGPVASYMNVNRGDRFEYLVSVSSAQLNLDEYRKANLPPEDPRMKEKYVCGDLNTSVIRTALGRTILLQHDVVSPRPYDRLNMISGTRGAFAGYPARIFLEGQQGGHAWQDPAPLEARHTHPLWKKAGEAARKAGGHGGMDFIMAYRTAQCMREGLVPDMDVYDAAAWSVPTELTAASVANGSQPAAFPDFTRGTWQNQRRPFTVKA